MEPSFVIRVLLVEDNPHDAQAARELLLELPGGSEPTIVGDRLAAISAIDCDFFDLIILDLKIPHDAHSDDPQPENGLAVFAHAKRVAPGTPLFLLTGSSVESFVPTLLENAERIDIWVSGAASRVSTVLMLPKLEFDRFGEKVLPYLQGVESLGAVELDRGAVVLSIEEERLVRICASRFRGVRCEVRPVSGGLSDAKVLRLKIQNSQGGTIQNCIFKIGTISDIRDESSRHQDHIVRLTPVATPRHLVTLEFGGKNKAAVCYQLAEGREFDFFQFINFNDPQLEFAFSRVKAGLRGWYDAATQGMRTIQDVRQRILSDGARNRVLEINLLDWTYRFEGLEIPVKWGCVHGDFHGGNVLLSAQGDPAIIDYGDVGEGPMSLDAIALEFSLFFHPNGPCKNGEWPTADQAEHWDNLDQYLVNCPYPEFIRQCRRWSIEMAAGSRERAAVAYAYLLRQLKYEDTDAELALRLLTGAKNLYDST
jgi:CheY-like chemotaxis protein